MRITRIQSPQAGARSQHPPELPVASTAPQPANVAYVNLPATKTCRVWRARSMQQIANSVLAASANLMHAIAHSHLPPDETMDRHHIHEYGAHLAAQDVRSVLRTMIYLGLTTETEEGDWKITPAARQIILQAPSLNWAQDHHNELQQVKNASWPRSLEEYTALNVLASNDVNDDMPFAGREIQAEVRSQGIDFSDERKRALMSWLVKNDYVEQVNKHDAYILTHRGAAKARTSMTGFAGAYSEAVDRVKGRAEASVYGGAGNAASSKLRQKRIHDIEHNYYSRLLQDVKEGVRAPGAPFPVSTKAATSLGMSYHDLKNVAQRLARWRVLESQGSGKFNIHQDAQNIIAGNQGFIWRADNATRLQKTTDAPEMPGTWAQQALLELIASGDIKAGDGFPSQTSIQKAFQANGQTFGPQGAASAFAWLQQTGLIVQESQVTIKRGYTVAPNAQARAQKILNDFRQLDTNHARPLVEIPAVYKQPLKPGDKLEYTFSPGLHNSQEKAAIFAHLLAKIASGEFTSETGLPSSKQAIAQLGLPGKVLTAAHSRALVEHNITARRDSGQSQTNAHRDRAPLLLDAQAEISASPYLRWMAASASALSSISDVLSPLNEAEYAVLAMVARRKYKPVAGVHSAVLLSPKALQDRIIQEAESQHTPVAIRTDAHAQYCHLAVKKYQKLGLIDVGGPTKKQLTYTCRPNAQLRAQQLLENFDAAGGQTAQRVPGRPQEPASDESGTDALSPGEASAIDLRLLVQGRDLQSAINASLRENRVQLSPNQIQQNNLPNGFRWHNPSPDGNCLFHAIARRFPDLGTHQQIRASVATAAEHNEHLDPQFRQEFVTAVSQPGEYTGVAETAIQVAAEAFDIRIRVFVEDGSLREFGPQNSESEMILARNQDHFFLMEQIPEVNMAGVFDDEISSPDSVAVQPAQTRRGAHVLDRFTTESPTKRPRPDHLL
jgi:hypothetical protein